MWIPAIISTAIIIFSVLLQMTLIQKGVINKKSKVHKAMEIIGLLIPFLVILGNYSYMKTDTTEGALIVTAGLYSCLALWVLFLSIWRSKKYNFVIFSATLFICCLIIVLITPYMLSSFQSAILPAVICPILGASIHENPYKGRMIITGILIILLTLMSPADFLNALGIRNKVERVSMAYVERQGYSFTKTDRITSFITANRNEPTHAFFFRLKPQEIGGIDSIGDLTYYRGRIIEYKKR